eukprot:324624_1
MNEFPFFGVHRAALVIAMEDIRFIDLCSMAAVSTRAKRAVSACFSKRKFLDTSVPRLPSEQGPSVLFMRLCAPGVFANLREIVGPRHDCESYAEMVTVLQNCPRLERVSNILISTENAAKIEIPLRNLIKIDLELVESDNQTTINTARKAFPALKELRIVVGEMNFLPAIPLAIKAWIGLRELVVKQTYCDPDPEIECQIATAVCGQSELRHLSLYGGLNEFAAATVLKGLPVNMRILGLSLDTNNFSAGFSR